MRSWRSFRGGSCQGERATMTKRTACIVAFTAAFVWATPVVADQFDAKVIGVADGDTLTVLFDDGNKKSPRRVRLSGIDAPEKAQAFGAVAKEDLARLAFGKVGSLDCRVLDQYGRSVCLVRVDGVDVGMRMIELGLAWHYKRYAGTQPREEAASYAMAEISARAVKRGLWRDLGTKIEPIPPWLWRKTATPDSAQHRMMRSGAAAL